MSGACGVEGALSIYVVRTCVLSSRTSLSLVCSGGTLAAGTWLEGTPQFT